MVTLETTRRESDRCPRAPGAACGAGAARGRHQFEGSSGGGLGQDPIEYNTHTHHTNPDTYERVIESDVKESAISIAATLNRLAMRDAMLPRFAPGEMPRAIRPTSSAQ
jgi:hypothetical protein